MSELALITAIGVLSSWLASDINCFCLLKASSTGFTILAEIRKETTAITAIPKTNIITMTNEAMRTMTYI